MKQALRVLIAGFAALSAVASSGDGSDDAMQQLFKAANERDVSRIEAIRRQAGESNVDVRVGAAIASYMVDPVRFADRFVDEFPSDPNGVMGIVFESIELPQDEHGRRLTPTFLYSFAELSALSMRGYRAATRKLLLATGSSDGVVAEFLCGHVLDLASHQPGTALDGLSQLDETHRKKVLAKCLGSASKDEVSALYGSLKSLDSIEAEIRTELSSD
jgi:hypothetical protein